MQVMVTSFPYDVGSIFIACSVSFFQLQGHVFFCCANIYDIIEQKKVKSSDKLISVSRSLL